MIIPDYAVDFLTLIFWLSIFILLFKSTSKGCGQKHHFAQWH